MEGQHQDLELHVSQMFFEPSIEHGKLGLVIHVPKQPKSVKRKTLFNYGSIVIEQLIGEMEFYSLITKISFEEYNEPPALDNVYPLNKLNEFIAFCKAQANNSSS